MTGNSDKRSGLVLSLSGALAFCLILWFLDFPKPYIDDLFYCGGGLSLAQGNGLSNPLIAGQGFANSFFVYPPLESYVLAGWLKLFGISAGSMTAFPVLMYFFISAATIAILRRHASPAWLEWLIPLAVGAAFLRTGGLRPDSLAIALIMGGAALLESDKRGKWRLFIGFLLLFLGASAAPRMAPFSLALAWFAGERLRRNSATASLSGRTVWWLAIAAFILSALVFLLMIHFQLADFLVTFRTHSSRAHAGFAALRMLLLDVMGVLAWPLLVLPIVLLLAMKGQAPDRLKSMAITLGVTFVACGCIGFLGPGSIWFAILVSLLLAGSGFEYLSGWHSCALKTLLIFALLIGNGRSLVNVYGILSGNLQPDQGGQRMAALALRPAPGHRLLVDVDQARYLFGYRIPPGYLAYEYAAPFPKTYPFEEFLPTDVYVVGSRTIDQLNERTLLNQPSPPKWKPIGPNRWWFNKYPRWVYIVPAESCKDVRVQR